MQKKSIAVSKLHTTNRNVDYIFIVLISIFILAAPFYRGLFFRVNYIPAIAIISIIYTAFIVNKLRDKNYRVIDTYMDLAVLMLPVTYLISFFFAVNKKDAFDMFLLYCSYFMMYKLVSDLSVRDERYKNVFINVIIVSAFVLSFSAMLNIAGIIHVNGASIGKRIYGLYQYANTSASVLGVGIVLTLNKLVNENNNKAIAVYQMVLTSLMSTFILTLSRGGYIVLTVVLLLNFLLVKASSKLRMLINLFITFISSTLFIYKYYILGEDQVSGVWVYYLISIAVSALLAYILCLLKNRVELKMSDKSISIALIAIVAVFMCMFTVLFSVKEPIEYRIEHGISEEESWKNKSIVIYELEPNNNYSLEFDVKASLKSPNSYGVRIRSYNNANEYKEVIKHFEETDDQFRHETIGFTTTGDTERIVIILYNYESNSFTIYKNLTIKDEDDNIVKRIEKLRYMPSVISSRLENISLETKNVTSRLYFARDGLKIIKDHPIVGAGGGGWKNLYRQYQSIPYNTTEVHNFYVQYGIEVGIIGFLFLTAILVLLIMSMVKGIKKRSYYLFVYLAVLLLLVHSTIDFNLSLAAVGYMLWMLIGIVSSENHVALVKSYTYSRFIKLFIVSASIFVLLCSASISYGTRLGNQAVGVIEEQRDIPKALELYEKATVFDRYNGAYRIDMAQLLVKQLTNTKDEQLFKAFEKQVSLMQKYEPYNHSYTSVLCNAYLALSEFDSAIALAEKKLGDEPLLSQSYALAIELNYKIAKYLFDKDYKQEAIPYLENIGVIKSRMDKINENQKSPLKLTDELMKIIEVSSKTIDSIKSSVNK